MRIFLTILTLFLFSVKHVHSLDCYATDFAAIESQHIYITPIEKSCEDFIEDILYKQGIIQPTFLNGDDLRCFTVRVDSDKANFAIQGCAPRDSCDQMVNSINMEKWALIEKDLYVDNVTCSQCEGAMCNGGITQSITMKNWFSLERKKYLVITLVIIIVFMTVISIMLRVFSRKRAFFVDKNYSLLKV